MPIRVSLLSSHYKLSEAWSLLNVKIILNVHEGANAAKLRDSRTSTVIRTEIPNAQWKHDNWCFHIHFIVCMNTLLDTSDSAGVQHEKSLSEWTCFMCHDGWRCSHTLLKHVSGKWNYMTKFDPLFPFVYHIYNYNRKHFLMKIQFASLHIKYIQNEKRLGKKKFNILKRYDTNRTQT